MSSQITRAQPSNIHPLTPNTNHLRHDFQLLSPFYSLPQSHYVTASHPSTGDKPPERGRAVPKNKNWPCETQSSTYASGSTRFPIFSALSRSLHRHSSVAQGYLHTIHPA